MGRAEYFAIFSGLKPSQLRFNPHIVRHPSCPACNCPKQLELKCHLLGFSRFQIKILNLYRVCFVLSKSSAYLHGSCLSLVSHSCGNTSHPKASARARIKVFIYYLKIWRVRIRTAGTVETHDEFVTNRYNHSCKNDSNYYDLAFQLSYILK
jgi:hypothetical protein